MDNNLPQGTTQESLDRALGWDDETPPELSEAELEAEYMEKLESAAVDAPPLVFHECAGSLEPLTLSKARRAEFRDFLKVLGLHDLRGVADMASQELAMRKPAGSATQSVETRRTA